jgi:Domain of unknown function (DUF4132)
MTPREFPNIEAAAEPEKKVAPPLDAQTTPKPLLDALIWWASPTNLPQWASPFLLPPLLVGGRRLSEEDTAKILSALRRTQLGMGGALLAAVRTHVERGSLDAFLQKLLERWLAHGASAEEQWALLAVGHLGGDALALKLTPLVRAWPGENKQARAVVGLECLRAIGTDTALMQLNSIAQNVKYQALKKKAKEFMEGIARNRKLTREQLEDRIVPDLGLDERGRRTFDFGPRQFRTVLGPDLRPRVRDADGKEKDNLPRPGAKDDAVRANAAAAAWKLLKKQLREVLKVQALRLEQAMVTGRRWTTEDFVTLLVRHPLQVNLVRRLVWGGYDVAGKRVLTFRVTEEQECADVRDTGCSLQGVVSVGVVHPLHLTEEERTAWGEVFGDYELIAPFPQLGRTVYRVEGEEAKVCEVTRFAGVKVPGVSVAGYLEKAGWRHGPLHDHGDFYEHYKHFPMGDVTARTEYEGGIWAGNIAAGSTVAVKRCTFLKGLLTPDGAWERNPPRALALGEVDPVVLSEVLAELTFLASKAE